MGVFISCVILGRVENKYKCEFEFVLVEAFCQLLRAELSAKSGLFDRQMQDVGSCRLWTIGGGREKEREGEKEREEGKK